MKTFIDKIKSGDSDIILYGMTPPKVGTEETAIAVAANRLATRVSGSDLDGLILYDVQDEKTRTSKPRPFPYMASIDPIDYYTTHLDSIGLSPLLYKCVGKYSDCELKSWVQKAEKIGGAAVFVGMASDDQEVTMTLEDAYIIKERYAPDLLLGAVMIPERHAVLGDEPDRMLKKALNGVSFFVTQMVYNVPSALNALADYKNRFVEVGQPIVPVIFTISPCGSNKTLEFMEWLGISIPDDVREILTSGDDMLVQSLKHCNEVIDELRSFCTAQNIPYGFNVESVAIKKSEVEAAVGLIETIQKGTITCSVEG
ncbi:MAG: methylenetetrahydrofolate reductase [Fibrobacterales bacterium]